MLTPCSGALVVIPMTVRIFKSVPRIISLTLNLKNISVPYATSFHGDEKRQTKDDDKLEMAAELHEMRGTLGIAENR